jgi:hypothetical protein
MYNGRLKNEIVPHRKKSFHFKDKPVSAVQAAINEARKYTLYKEFRVLRRIRKITKHDFEVRHGYLSVRMVYLGSHRADFDEICCLSIFRKSVLKISLSLIKI